MCESYPTSKIDVFAKLFCINYFESDFSSDYTHKIQQVEKETYIQELCVGGVDGNGRKFFFCV